MSQDIFDPEAQNLRYVVRRVWLGCGLLTLLGVLALAWNVSTFNNERETTVRNEGARLARALQGEVGESIRVVDMSLLGLVGRMQQHAGSPEAIARILKDEAPRLPGYFYVTYANADGDGVASTASDYKVGSKYADRDYYLAHKNARLTGVFISAPIVGRTLKKQIIVVSRRVEAPDGRLLGILLGAVETKYLAEKFADFTPGPNGTVTLVHTVARRIVARAPEHESSFNADVSKMPPFLAGELPDAGFFEAPAATDGTTRLYSFHRVNGLPLAVVVAHARGDLRAELNRQIRLHSFAGLIMTVLIAALGVLIVRAQRHSAAADLRYREQLEGRVSERTAELASARDEAERLAQVKSEFLANMSHEIRTPLNAVLGLAQIGLRESHGRTSERLFHQMLASGRLLLGIINDILDFSKIDAGKLAIESEAIDLEQLVAHLRILSAEPATEKGLIFAVSVTPDTPRWFLGDLLRLSQVLGNLLSNALKFTAQGEIRLTIETREGQLVFTISDSGIGMDAAQLQRLFVAFEQADVSTTRKFGGTGLGLAISQRLMTLMGGTIKAQSTLGVGSRFIVSVPLRVTTAPVNTPDPIDADAGASSPLTQPIPLLTSPLKGEGLDASAPLAGYRILAAEDNPVNQMVLEDMLTMEGASVVFADDGLIALDLLGQMGDAAFDIVLTDIQMPRMDGHQLARHLRQSYPGLPVIGVTAHALDEDRERCRANGMVEHLTKPIDLPTLVAAVQKHARLPPGDSLPPVT